MAHHDSLTGVANRRLFEQELPRELARAKRNGSLTLRPCPRPRHFKAYNDKNGHVAGDRLLKATASAWSDVLRSADLLARMGGDEFVALLPDCMPEEAVRVAQRLTESVPLGQTCSTGIACWDGRESSEALIGRADKYMYAAQDPGPGPRHTLSACRRSRARVYAGPIPRPRGAFQGGENARTSFLADSGTRCLRPVRSRLRRRQTTAAAVALRPLHLPRRPLSRASIPRSRSV